MSKSFTRLALIAVLFSAGCASQAEFLNTNQPSATQTAVARAQFEMNCQQVTPTIISREVVQPALQGPWVNGIQRAEYTIGVTGCGRRSTFVVICPDGGAAVLPPAPVGSTIGSKGAVDATCTPTREIAGAWATAA
jgi:hypothetical protein